MTHEYVVFNCVVSVSRTDFDRAEESFFNQKIRKDLPRHKGEFHFADVLNTMDGKLISFERAQED